ncbi:Pol polyprotein [Elysia marginata]|uniref:Pol polyprotein n=1 Tax=Elysia marginata TaxID=1093978 RepID=A0AAV4EF48_9GAST|nr:Pol polyprotein [Elysia marginata]
MAPIIVKKKRLPVQEEHNKKQCKASGSSHPPKQCAAYGKTCHKCKGKNNFVTVCGTSSAKFKTRPRIQELEVEEEYFWVGQIESNGCEAKTKRWSVEAQVCDSKIKMKVKTDPKVLNKNIKREIFEIPTFERIVPQLGGKKVFTTSDQKDAYWQVELDKASSRLCRFDTPFRHFCFKRMPFGISSASEILQKRAYETFGDIQGLHILHDDALIAAENGAECYEILLKVLKRA